MANVGQFEQTLGRYCCLSDTVVSFLTLFPAYDPIPLQFPLLLQNKHVSYQSILSFYVFCNLV